MHGYDPRFFQRVDRRSLPTARALVPLVHRWLRPRSVADFGCGAGSWLAVWKEQGVPDLVGVDSARLPSDCLHVPPACLVQADLSQPVRLGRQFDLIQCLEVGEHLPASRAEVLVDSLVTHSRQVLFSAALPGQGGWRHVNERPPEYWARLFAAREYELFDCVRPRLLTVPSIRRCSAYNTFLLVHRGVRQEMPHEVSASHIPPGQRIDDLSPWWFRLARKFVGIWPVRVVSTADRFLQYLHRVIPLSADGRQAGQSR